MYHMYSEEQPDPKKRLLEKLFLKLCAPIMYKLMQKTIPTECEGCQRGWSSQMEHKCLGYGDGGPLWVDFLTLTASHYEKAVPFMVQKLPKVNK